LLLKKSIPITLLLCIAVSLLNLNVFGDASMFSYFLYTILVSVLAILVVFDLWVKRNVTLHLSLPVISFLLFVFYILGQSIINKYFFIPQGYWIANTLLFLSAIYWVNITQEKNREFIYKGIAILAITESIIVLLQFLKIVPTFNKYFAATGTWVNPNVTAMFLAISLPIIIAFTFKPQFKKYTIASICIVALALLLLLCRTAIIGAVVAITILLNAKYGYLQTIFKKYNALKLAVIICIVFSITTAMGYFLYTAKQSSADGRKIVWQISSSMLSQKPITGYGYGSFAKAYNSAQANYFSTNANTTLQKANASYIQMAYNEFLQNAVEGGFVGFLLFTILLAVLLLNKKIFVKDTNNNVNKINAAIIAFAVMGIFNFTLQAIPVMVLFIINMAIVNENYKQYYIPIKTKIVKQSILSICLSIIAVFSVYQTLQADAYIKLKSIPLLIKNGNASNAITQLQALQYMLQNEEKFWVTYGNALRIEKSYVAAIDKYKNAISLKPYCDNYLSLAQCYIKTNHVDSAIVNCINAKNAEPNRMLPTYSLMQIYLNTKDSNNAIVQAKELVNIKPKVATKEALFYKYKAKQLLIKSKI
jgi:O-antigen polymerase